MTQVPDSDVLTLDDILNDLVTLVETVASGSADAQALAYEDLHQALAGKTGLHTLNYVRFLENHGYLSYDRTVDAIQLTQSGENARHEPHKEWLDLATQEFADFLEDAESEVDDVMMLDEDNSDDTGFLILDDGDDEDQEERNGEGAELNSTSVMAGEDIAVMRLVSASEYSDDEVQNGELEPVSIEAEENSLLEVYSDSEELSCDDEQAEPQEVEAHTFISSDNISDVQEFASPVPGEVRRTEYMTSLYERIQEIGSGGIGTVYLGRQTRLEREVAIKEVREIFHVFAHLRRDDIVAHLTSIVQTQAKLAHTNIVQILDIVCDGEYPYVVSQYAPNGNLRRLIDRDERPPIQVALKYFLQILHALNVAHERGVVHGSLKPENIVLDAAGNALVSDFGMARVVERETGRGNQVYVGVGTVAYMSPEQFQDPTAANIQSDMYSLGIMLYELLTGKLPGRRSPMPSSFYPDIPRKLDDIFDRMSMDDPLDRYESVDEILNDIYNADEIVQLIDRRSGVLFLRDPITHGSDTAVSPRLQPFAEATNEEELVLDARYAVDGPETNADDDLVDADLLELVEDEDLDDSAKREAHGAASVLDKLEKYGALFEDEGV